MNPNNNLSVEQALQNSVDLALAAMPSAGGGDANIRYTLESQRVPVDRLNTKHELWELLSESWDIMQILYVGGTALEKNAAKVLTERPKELKEVYERRCEHIRYQNIFGTVCGWYLANLFKMPPVVEIKQGGATLKAPDPTKANVKPNPVWAYYDVFQKDCDRNGTTLEDFAKEAFRQMMVFGCTYTVIDLPKTVQNATNRAEQDEHMLPYLCSYDPRSAINWEVDQYGALEWIVFYSEATEQTFLQAPVTVKRWFYYDRVQFAVYESRSDDRRLSNEPDEMATLVDSGPHACAAYKNADGSIGRVPVIKTEVPDVLRFGERVRLQCLSHLNMDNTLEWGLMLGNLAMPVVYTDSEYKPTLSEIGMIKLRSKDRFDWAEPSGRTFVISKERLAEIREEIYRAMYVLSQGRSSSATASASSGLSKQLDGAPATDVVNTFGQIIRAYLQLTMNIIASIREDGDVTADVRGLNMADEEELASALLNGQEALTLDIPSDTFRKEVQKDIVGSYGRDWNAELIAQINKEIDASPSMEEKQQADQEAANKGLADTLQKNASLLVLGTPTPAQPPKD